MMVSGLKFQVSKYTKGTVPFVYFLLVLLMAFTFASCSKDDDGDGGGYDRKIVGYWVNGKAYYRFDADGTGMYESGNDVGVWGNFKYNLSGTTVYMRVTYMNKYGTVWHDDNSGSYNSKDDTFRCDGKVYKRE